MTKINWCDRTWNPITGCDPVSEGCQHCYAARMARRLAGRCGYDKTNPFQITLHDDKLDLPIRTGKPCRWFVNSMGDLFHWNVPSTWVEKVIWSADKAYKAHGHRFMILTKRVETMLHFIKTTTLPGDLRWLWMGITAENQQRYDERIRDLVTLRLVGLNCRLFVSCEPLLGPIALGINYPRQLDLVIAGPETGPGNRPCNPEWIEDLKGQANAAGAPFVDKRERKRGVR